MSTERSTKALIDALVQSTGAPDAVSAIRLKAQGAIERFRAALGEPTIPINVEALASFLGIPISTDFSIHSKDAELVPTSDGRIVIRVNPDRSETRRRFSVVHEISHTFFPNFETKTWCRTDARHRRRDNPEEFVEMLCDIGASELLMPAPWFISDAARVTDARRLADLALKYGASREAMLRRFAETHSNPLAAVFLSWKLKPTQERTIGRLDQRSLFGTDLEEELRRAKKLRVDYSIPSNSATQDHYIPKDKSVENTGPLGVAAFNGLPSEGECSLDFGSVAGRYRVMAIPVWTDEQDLGPNGENAVAAVIEPIAVKASSRRRRSGPTFFD